MKTRSLFLLSLSQVLVTAMLAQTPVVKPPVVRPQQQPINNNIPVIRNNTNIALNLTNPLNKYDASAPVKYIFYDESSFTQVTGRTLPENGEYISIYTVVNGEEYTVVPADDLGIENTASGIHNVTLKLSNGPRAIGFPSGPAVWRVGKSSTGTYTLAYNGAFGNINAQLGVNGGFLGTQTGQLKISGGATGIAPSWQLQPVTEGGNTLLQLQNTGDSKFLGFTYQAGRSVAGMPQVYLGFNATELAATGCPVGTMCGIKWMYKIFTGTRSTGRPIHSAPFASGQYMIRTAYDNLALSSFGPTIAWGTTTPTMDEMQWQFEPTSRGTYFIFNKKNNQILGINKADGKFAFAPLNTMDFYNTDNFQWIIYGPFGGRYTMVPLMDKARPNGNALTWNRVTALLQPQPGGSYYQEFLIGQPTAPLWGYIDMHTHPMSYLGFGGEFFYGAVDGDPATALGNCDCYHNYNFGNGCENLIRNQMMDALDNHTKGPGYPDFANWPKQTTTTHQQMWYEWIDRARKSGLRMIVALAQSSHTLADAMETRGPYDDLTAMDAEIRELIAFVGRHRTLMDTVTTAARMRSVIQSQRLAVVIGIEMDHIGNFYNPAERRSNERPYVPSPTEAQVKAEIDRIYNMGVRYVFPIHIINNVFGGAAVYGEDIEPLVFNMSNFYCTGAPFDVETVSTAATGINYKCIDLSNLVNQPLLTGLLDVLRNASIMPVPSEVLNVRHYSYPNPGPGMAHRNRLGLTPLGEVAVKYMMSKGIMIDIDHMSEKSVSRTLQIAMQFNYPVNSGHNGPRGSGGNEKTRTNGQYDTLRILGGMVGVGSGDGEATSWASIYHTVSTKMGGTNVTFGTDVGVGAKLPHAPAASARLTGDIPGLPPTHTGNKTWDYNTYNTEGVDHYGMMPEFVRSLDRAGFTANDKNELFSSAEYFVRMWEKCELNKRNVR